MPFQLRLKLPFSPSSPRYSLLPSASPGTSSRRNLPFSSPPSKLHLSRRKYDQRLAILCLALSIFSLVLFFSRLSSYPYDGLSNYRDEVRRFGWMDGFQRVLHGQDNCRGWNPDLPEELDPVNCLKARQYRQTMRVLAREMEAKQCVSYRFPSALLRRRDNSNELTSVSTGISPWITIARPSKTSRDASCLTGTPTPPNAPRNL